MKNYFILIITILWIGLIFTFSSDNKEKSANKSYYIAEKVTPYIRENQNMNFEEINHIIRKTAHFINYTILGVLLVFNARINFRKNIAYVVFFFFLNSSMYRWILSDLCTR